ncbi:response regulator transcription factor [Alkalihalobacillus oceani]|uniref:response regulator transcription factor n=1 Tax=Halalkalibacter oceani TaxID=1653776 RepID=UPI00203EBCC5|nr:response regulator transcription factor [Halalkalibacter oceani]MCM3763034.1 response regulator transcription factor [Halalkalibacter oceani]
MKRVLIVDDEQKMHTLISICIQSANFEVETAYSGEQAIQILEEKHFDLMLLDIMMPKMDGLQVLKQLKHRKRVVPTIILSALGETDQIVDGLNNGAYDYVIKPFEPKELVARIHSVLRRAQPSDEDVSINRMYGITLNQIQQTVTYKNKTVIFTKKEYGIFARLFSQPGRVYTREQLMYLEWDDLDDRNYRNVDTHIKNVRDKLKQAGVEQSVVETVWGVGYRIPQQEDSKERYY